MEEYIIIVIVKDVFIKVKLTDITNYFATIFYLFFVRLDTYGDTLVYRKVESDFGVINWV